LKILFEFRSIISYNGENKFDVLFPILQKYDIVRKFKTVINDNSGINDILYRIIKAYLRREEEDHQ
jgi:hypothetical protein